MGRERLILARNRRVRRALHRLLILAAGAVGAGVAGAGVPGGAGVARAEAPYFYDGIDGLAVYDPSFDPERRGPGGLEIMAQAWSQPEAENPGQGLSDQGVTGQYRLRWGVPLDPSSDLRLELKAATRGQVVSDDYFLKGEFFYKGAGAPLWAYVGMRLPKKANALGYLGVESPSHRLGEIFPGFDPPLGFRGFAELRLSQDEHHPTLRLSVLGHTFRPRRSGVVVGVGMDGFFRDQSAPRWVLQGHAEVLLGRRVLRLAVVAGYEAELGADASQRLSLGVREPLF